jgi:DNA-nicking Smr family endonuclease
MAKHRDSAKDGADDSETFREAMQDVRPLPAAAAPRAGAKSHHPRPAAALAHGRARARQGTANAAAQERAAPAVLVAASVTAEQRLGFRRAGVREQVLRRLRRGLYPIDAELDLHGVHQDEAHELLVDFIALNIAAGRRCVRVIHGKGMRSGPRGAILKSAVDQWLRRHHDVKAFVSARPLDGGTGAVYVLLRA